jgi:hypothetical protein
VQLLVPWWEDLVGKAARHYMQVPTFVKLASILSTKRITSCKNTHGTSALLCGSLRCVRAFSQIWQRRGPKMPCQSEKTYQVLSYASHLCLPCVISNEILIIYRTSSVSRTARVMGTRWKCPSSKKIVLLDALLGEHTWYKKCMAGTTDWSRRATA